MPEQLHWDEQRPAWLDKLRHDVKAWADRGVYFGGSSWKYAGWLDQIYTKSRYVTRGKFSESRFNNTCLGEYAEWFPMVCGDFSFYRFYEAPYWKKLFAQVPETFLFGFKAPEALTSPVHTEHTGPPAHRGAPNENFLNPDVAAVRFVEPLLPYAKQIGYIIFEFPQFHRSTPEKNRQFLEKLDAFLGKLPKLLPYSVEIRTKTLLGDNYLTILRRHGVAHVFNSWTHMPSIGEQLQHEKASTADFTVARLLLRPGRTYNEAVDNFQPYDSIRDPFPEGYRDAAELIRQAKAKGLRRVFVPTNNRYAGNSPQTIGEIIKEL